MEGIAEGFEDQSAGIIGCTEGEVLGEGLGGLVELEAGEYVEGEALAGEGEEMAGSSPADEL